MISLQKPKGWNATLRKMQRGQPAGFEHAKYVERISPGVLVDSVEHPDFAYANDDLNLDVYATSVTELYTCMRALLHRDFDAKYGPTIRACKSAISVTLGFVLHTETVEGSWLRIRKDAAELSTQFKIGEFAEWGAEQEHGHGLVTALQWDFVPQMDGPNNFPVFLLTAWFIRKDMAQYFKHVLTKC